MLFNSFAFLVFFTIVTCLYFMLPHKNRWFLLLTASVYFYMYFIPIYILILAFTIVIDYFAGIFLENAQGRRKKLFLIASLVANIGVLAVFKYYNFLNNNITVFLHSFNIQNHLPVLSILLPIGLSFHTFQAMSYTIEIYRGHQKAERHFGIYALYVMFYPQLVAGPIERPQNLLHQFYEKHYFDIQRIADGLRLMLWGLFKKAVVADRLALYVDTIYNHPGNRQGFELIIATFFFAIQIYCDFSGYSDMAIGAAKVMGFKLMINFNKPYFSKSVGEFWQRWHISLSTWFKDYLYITLGGNRVVKWRWYFNLILTFVISGIWHGANWTFIIWGLLNGLFLVMEFMTHNYTSKISSFLVLARLPLFNNVLKIIVTFTLIDFAWIFFRANSLSDARYIIGHLFAGLHQTAYVFIEKLPYIVLIILYLIIEFLTRNKPYPTGFSIYRPLLKRYLNIAVYSSLIWIIIVFGEFGSREFIYFQF